MFKSLVFAFIALTLIGCNSSSSSDDPSTPGSTKTGKFKDSNVIGLGYSSVSHSGLTNSTSEFTYVVGETISFSVGAVSLGSTSAKPTISPIDLINAGTSSSVEVQNIVRFLLMLDVDDDPANGIEISAAVTAAAATWNQVDFSAADLDIELAAIIVSVNNADTRTAQLPNAVDAQAHLEDTLRCIYAGAFVGNFTGDDSGHFGLRFDAGTGGASGSAYSNGAMALISLSGGDSVSFDQDVTFSSNFLNPGGVGVGSFSGQFDSTDTISGTWENPAQAESGGFSAQRIGGLGSANYRFTGGYTDSGPPVSLAGLFTFDVDENDVVSGMAYNYEDNTSFTISGSAAEPGINNLAAVASDGTVITGILNKSTGGLSGSWVNGVDGGNFGGNGCRLN